jgi:uncharacterized membrane protein
MLGGSLHRGRARLSSSQSNSCSISPSFSKSVNWSDSSAVDCPAAPVIAKITTGGQVSGEHPRERNLKKGKFMGTTTHSIDVKAPLRSVYDQWTQFEEFPRFMRDVVEVRQHGANALSWKVLMGGKEKQWEARIIEQIPDTSIVWESVDGTSNRGAITFEPLGAEATRLTVVMEYEPEGFLEKAADLLGVPSGHVEESLKSFRELIESKDTVTGGWRGRIESTGPEEASIDRGLAAEFGTKSPDGLRASNEEETYGQALPVTEVQTGEHEAAMVARPNGTEQNVQKQNSSSMNGKPEIPSATAISVPDPTLQAVPVTELEAGEHEAGMVSRASDDRETERGEPMDIALDDLERENTHSAKAEDHPGNIFSEPEKEEIARRAFDLYLARGQAPGHEMDDWVEAKRQLVEEHGSKV